MTVHGFPLVYKNKNSEDVAASNTTRPLHHLSLQRALVSQAVAPERVDGTDTITNGGG
jgi:hypothetical protein